MISNIIVKILYFIDKNIHQKNIEKKLIELNKNYKNLLDIGSHQGDYTYMLKKIYKKSSIHCFEPQKELIKRAKIRNRKLENIHYYNLGLDKVNGVKKIKIASGSNYISTFSKIRKNSQYVKIRDYLINTYNNYKFSKIHMKKLDDIKKLKKIKFDLMKIDVEGFELNVLQGASRTLKNIECIIIEFHNNNMYLEYSNKKIHKLLVQKGYSLKSKIKFPLLKWEDRIYLKEKNYK
jgi:FkbM family methyltransferase